MYHIRLDYFDNKIKVVRTFFEYDYPSKEKLSTMYYFLIYRGSLLYSEELRLKMGESEK